jgi:hypothetical protein
MLQQYVNNRDVNGICSAHGHKTEDVFHELLKAEGFPVRRATRKEDMFEHFDFEVNKNNKLIKYEVKARKRVSRSDDNYQDELIWCEILNVLGENGWVFACADYIAFEREKDFVIVEREKLADFIKLKCNLRKQAYRAEDALYCRYQRRGRKDCLTLIKGSDIEGLAERFIKKVA